MVSRILKKVIASPSKLKVKTGKKKQEALKSRGYAKSRASDKFISRRQILGGAQAALKKDPSVKTYASGLREGMITGAGATVATTLYLKNKKARKDAQAKDDKALKKAIEKHKADDKKRKDAYGKRAPKKDKNYGGR
jgi:hypothetical protein